MSESAKQKQEREAAEAAAAKQAQDEEAKADEAGADEPDPNPAGRDLRTAGEASTTAGSEHPDQNRTTFARGEEMFAAEQMVRGGVTPVVTYPKALPREDQVTNAEAIGAVASANATGTKDGISSVYPQVGGATNLAMTTSEVLARLDDGAVDGKGRLVGVYLDDLQEEAAQRHRDRIEQRTVTPEAVAAADRVRALAGSSVISGADLGKPADQRALIDPQKHTSRDGDDPNDPAARDRQRVDAEQGKPASAQA